MANHNLIKSLPSILKNHFTDSFVQRNISSVIAYGSGVFPQQKKMTKNTIDLIVVSKDAQRFHEQSLQFRKNDYEGMSRVFGIGYVNMLNRFIFPLHFNHISVANCTIKYSVVDRKVVLDDLKTWKYLTLAGRLHKPIINNLLNQSVDTELSEAIKDNRRYALKLAMILRRKTKQNTFSELFEYISRLSYLGDIRFTIPVENPNKVSNIVNNNLLRFREIYLPLLQQLKKEINSQTFQLFDSSYKLNYSAHLIKTFIKPQRLPISLVKHLEQLPPPSKSNLSTKFILQGSIELPKEIQKFIISKNRSSSFWMGSYNILASSLLGNIKYIWKKLKKRSLK